MLVSADAYGSLYQFAIGDSDIPAIDNFITQQLELKFDEALVAYARDLGGTVQAMVTSKPGRRKITAILTGLIAVGAELSTISDSFSFDGRFYIIRTASEGVASGVSQEMPKSGDFRIITLMAESHPAINSLGAG